MPGETSANEQAEAQPEVRTKKRTTAKKQKKAKENAETEAQIDAEGEAKIQEQSESFRNAYRIIDLDENDRPRERLKHLGAQSLTNAELIAILLRVGVPGENAVQVGQRLLKHFGGLAGLHRADIDLLCAEHGIGTAKAAHIKRRLNLVTDYASKRRRNARPSTARQMRLPWCNMR